jgi:hypothetical protein
MNEAETDVPVAERVHPSTALNVVAGLCVGNFLWQMLSFSYDWQRAFDRSYFQAIAIGLLWFTTRRRAGDDA